MNIKQMVAFRELMRTGSVSRAAQNLHRTQPAISYLIKSLEDELNMALFIREGKRLIPVPEATYLLKECENILRRIEIIGENLERMKNVEQGELRIVSMPGPASFFIPDLIAQHVSGGAALRASLHARASPSVRQLIGSQQFDLGLADHDPDDPPSGSLQSVQVFRFSCLCAVPAGDPLLRAGQVRLADLSGQPMASLNDQHRMHEQTRLAFAQSGARFDVHFETNHFIQLLTFVQNRLAYAIVDPLTADAYRIYAGGRDDICFLPLEQPIDFFIEKLTPSYRPLSVMARAFSDRLTQRFEDLGGIRLTP